MSNWREIIFNEFTPNVSRVTLVADPDGLLLEESVLKLIMEHGFEIFQFDDPIAFRYIYESKHRTIWDSGNTTDQNVVLHFRGNNLTKLPYDLLQTSRKLRFNLGDLFPNLSYPVVSQLNVQYLDAVFDAQSKYSPNQLGDNATKEFILRHVFEIAPELIKQPSDLLRVLLRRHYRRQMIPAIIDDRFIQLLRHITEFDKWPLDQLLRDREAFITFLQERWSIFLDSEAVKTNSTFQKDKLKYDLIVKGPIDLPFNHDDIRVYIDNLFVEGLLNPVQHEQAEVLSKSWVNIGIRTISHEWSNQRLNKLVKKIWELLPTENANHSEWFNFAHVWSELNLLINQHTNPVIEGKNDLASKVDFVFTEWLIRRYAGLVNLPPSPPVMLHHVPRFLSRQLADDHSEKIALIVVDGLALDQWLLIRNSLNTQQSDLCFREHEVFAWIPTLTSVSRQAIFAGKTPVFFANSIHTTEKESALWSQFWINNGYVQNEIFYFKGLGDGNLDYVSEALSHPKIKIVGLVIDKIDKIMHGMEMGSIGMHNQISLWMQNRYLNNLIELLLQSNYQIFLTSDHGNVEAEGCGRPSEGILADLRGQRVRIYSDDTLRSKSREGFPFALEWENIGLPDDYLVLLAPARKAFVEQSHRIVSHGGISIEEMIVPFVQIEKQS